MKPAQDQIWENELQGGLYTIIGVEIRDNYQSVSYRRVGRETIIHCHLATFLCRFRFVSERREQQEA